MECSENLEAYRVELYRLEQNRGEIKYTIYFLKDSLLHRIATRHRVAQSSGKHNQKELHVGQWLTCKPFQSLLGSISKPTKSLLGKIGIFSVGSLHAIVS